MHASVYREAACLPCVGKTGVQSGTSALREYAIAAFFAYFSIVRITHIFSAHIGIFDGNVNEINVLCVSI